MSNILIVASLAPVVALALIVGGIVGYRRSEDSLTKGVAGTAIGMGVLLFLWVLLAVLGLMAVAVGGDRATARRGGCPRIERPCAGRHRLVRDQRHAAQEQGSLKGDSVSNEPTSLARRIGASALALAAAGFFLATAILRPEWPVNGALLGAGLVVIGIFIGLQLRKP